MPLTNHIVEISRLLAELWDMHIAAMVASPSMKTINTTGKALALVVALTSTVFMAGAGSMAAFGVFVALPDEIEEVRGASDSIQVELTEFKAEVRQEVSTINRGIEGTHRELCIIRVTITGVGDTMDCVNGRRFPPY